MTGAWVYGAILALLVLHVVALRYAYRNGQRAIETSEVGSAEYVTEDGVECPECGELNDHEYRYCRQCVSELPGGVSGLDSNTTARDPRMF